MTYPTPITRTSPFDDVQAESPPEKSKQSSERSSNVTHSAGTGNPGMVLSVPRLAPLCGWKKLCIFVGDKVSQGLTSSEANKSTKVSAEAFSFAPGEDTAFVGWDLPLASDATKVKVELLRGDKKAVKLKTAEHTDLAFLAKGKKDDLGLTGSIRFEDLVELDDEDFPAGLPTVEHSPYRLKLTLETGGDGYPLVGWTYFHVLVGGIEFDWFPEPRNVIPLAKEPRAQHVEVNNALSDADDVRGEGDQSNLAGGVPKAGEVKEVPISANVYYQGETHLPGKTNPHFKKLYDLWGDGPMVPILAKVLVRTAAGEAVDAPGAVGKVKLLWNWVDKTVQIPMAADVAMTSVARRLETWVTYKPDETTDSPEGWSCHVDFGGKRGPGGAPVFPTQAGTDPVDELPTAGEGAPKFPFKVTQCSDRKWAVTTETWPKGELQGRTGVIFQPSRMAGDSYALQVLLVPGEEADAVEGVKDFESYAAPKAETGEFQVWHRLDLVKYIQIGRATDVNVASVQANLRYTFIDLTYDDSRKVDGTAQVTEALKRVYDGDLRESFPDYVQCALPHAQTDTNVCVEFLPFSGWRSNYFAMAGGVEAAYKKARAQENPKSAADDEIFMFRDRAQFDMPQQYPLMQPWPLEITEVEEDTQGKVTVEITHPETGKVHSEEVIFEADKRVTRSKNVTLTNGQVQTLAKFFCKATEHNGNEVVYNPNPGSGYDSPLKVTLKGKTGGDNKKRMVALRDAFAKIAEARMNCSAGSSWFPSEVRSEPLGLGGVATNPKIYQSMVARQWVWPILRTVVEAEWPASGGGLYLVQVGKAACNFHGPKGKALFAQEKGDSIVICLNPHAKAETFEHELGHCKFLNHTYVSQSTSDPLKLHDEVTVGKCTMVATGVSNVCRLCAICHLRLRGWSLFKVTDPVAGTFDLETQVLNHNDHPSHT